jgi:uncharacterized protein
MATPRNVPEQAEELADFCRRWGISELWLFGSLARGQADAGSDADLFLRFLPTSTASTWDWPTMTDELEAIFGRPVDLITEGALRNPFRRESILRDRKVLYAA